MKTTPVKGTNEYLPKDAELRNKLQQIITNVYKENGFSLIQTPALEDIENLNKSDGGDNLNLIFKILQRGEKLTSALENKEFDNLSDIGLRYDLTLPLTRFYANNKENLPNPFKVIQIDKVYRAERPQKGRLREFIQCDIDIIGSNSINNEIELICVTAKALQAVSFKDFTVVVNSRKILNKILIDLGFAEKDLLSVCITFDKLDKIGLDGIKQELTEKEQPSDAINNLCKLLEKPITIENLKEKFGEFEELNNIEKIVETSKKLVGPQCKVEFDISLVRGQGYYTGTVFEVKTNEFNCSIAGGGRYDNLIGKFLGENIPAVGFSIGFERIFSILKDKDYKDISSKQRIALFYEPDDIIDALTKAEELRKDYYVSIFETPKKLSKFLDKISNLYDGFIILKQKETISLLNKS